MRVLELSLRNFRVFEEVDLELPARTIGIFGENGSGKSTLMESVAFACYGVDAARTKKQHIRTHGVLTDCEVRLVFEHAGTPYEIRRSIKGRGHVPEAELFAGGLQLASGTTDVDAEVRRLLHMDLHVFRSSVFAEQKQLDAFSDLRPGERKQMALRLLGIRPVEDARATARREARATKERATQLADVVADVAALEADLKEAKGVATAAKQAARAAASAVKGATATAKSARAAFEEIDGARQRVETLTALLRGKTEERDAHLERLAGLEERVRTLTEAVEEAPALEEELEALGDVEERLRGARRLVEARGRLEAAEVQLASAPAADPEGAAAALADAEAAHQAARVASAQADAERDHRAESLERAKERLARAAEADPSQPCPTCGRPLGDDFGAYVRHCKAEVTEAKSAAASARRTAKEAAVELRRAAGAFDNAAAAAGEAQRARDRRARLEEQAETLRAEVAGLLAPFVEAVPDVDELEGQMQRARAIAARLAELGAHRTHLQEAERDLASVHGRLDALEGDLEALTREAAELAFDPAEHERRRTAFEEADAALDASREAERQAFGELSEAERRVSELSGRLQQARETAAAVDELRSEARYVERVALLLDGFRDHLVARVGPELSREAESLFRELTNHEYDDLRVDDETLSIQIADGDTYFAIDRFSGSESDLANLALRVAISSHLSRVSGADVGLLVLDEVLGSLDAERKDLMVQALGRLSARFHQVFVITHSDRVKDQFPASILVRKAGRRRSTATLV